MLDRGHPFFPTFERLMARAATRTPGYDLGTNGRFAKEIGLVRHLFEENAYKARGNRPERLADQSVGSVVSLSVLEHVVDPLRAVHQCTTCG